MRSLFDLRMMQATQRFDVVDICTSSGAHHGHPRQAMNRGCHVIVDEPMAMDVGLIDDMNSEGQASTGECGHVFTPRIVPKEGVVYMGQGIRHARTCPPCKAPSRRNPFLGGIDLLDSRPSFPVHTVLVLGHAPGYNPGLLRGRRLPRRTYILVRMALARGIRPGTGSGQPLAQRTHILVRMAWVRGPRSGIYPGIRSGQAILQRTPVLVRTVPGTTRTC